MEYNQNINVSILRLMLLDKEENQNTEFEVIYKNGIYVLINNFQKFQDYKKNAIFEFEVKIVSDMSQVVNHLEYRLVKEKLNPIESALLFKELEQIHGVSTSSIAKKLHKTPGDISNKKRLLKLPLYVQTDIISNQLTERHGRALLQLINQNKKSRIKDVYEEIKIKKLKVADAEKIIDKIIDKQVKKVATKGIDKSSLKNRLAVPAINQLENDLKKSRELIEKYYPQLEIVKEEGLENQDYVLKVIIKNVK